MPASAYRISHLAVSSAPAVTVKNLTAVGALLSTNVMCFWLHHGRELFSMHIAAMMVHKRGGVHSHKVRRVAHVQGGEKKDDTDTGYVHGLCLLCLDVLHLASMARKSCM